MADLSLNVKYALLSRFAGTDQNGWLSAPEENLIEGVSLQDVADDVKRGAGNELQGKFRAVHSSSALQVNAFAPFHLRPESLALLGRTGFRRVSFEERIPTGVSTPNIDVWIEGDNEIIAIESKLKEFLDLKKADYRPSYTRDRLPYAEDCWWRVLEESKAAGACHLDVAQLVKHYLGVIRHLRESEMTSATLLYLFWEPTNWQSFELFARHREEVASLASKVAESDVQFRSMTYSQLWEEWLQNPAFAYHVGKLRDRYEVALRIE